MDKAIPNKEPKLTQDDELVLTPGGLRPKSKVHFVKPGQHIDGENGRLKIIDSETGEIIKDLGDAVTESTTTRKRGGMPRSGEELEKD